MGPPLWFVVGSSFQLGFAASLFADNSGRLASSPPTILGYARDTESEVPEPSRDSIESRVGRRHSGGRVS